MTTFSRVYDSYEQAHQAVQDLEAIGVPSGDISIVASQTLRESTMDADDISATSSGAGIGAALGGGAGLLAGLGLMVLPGLGPVVAAGWLASTALGLAAGAVSGGLVGALIDAGASEDEAHVYSEAILRGGTLVIVRTDFESDKIEPVLDSYRPIDPARRRAEYQRSGWDRFDSGRLDYKVPERKHESYRKFG